MSKKKIKLEPDIEQDIELMKLDMLCDGAKALKALLWYFKQIGLIDSMNVAEESARLGYCICGDKMQLVDEDGYILFELPIGKA